jgi:hypothetical protein
MQTRKPVWKRAAPARAKHHGLAPAKKSAARQRAKRAGRPYPNLVDNMRAARKKTSHKKSPSKKKAGSKRRNPRVVTAKGRRLLAAYHRSKT